MKSLALTAALAALAADAHAQRLWQPLVGVTLWDIYSPPPPAEGEDPKIARLVSSDSRGWPDGRQSYITYLEVTQGSKKWLYRCIEDYDSNTEPRDHRCFELRNPKKGK
jgi:hypothetical protein